MSYSETEAARKLGISVDHLRTLVRNHIAAEAEAPVESFRPSDLVVLRILAARSIALAE